MKRHIPLFQRPWVWFALALVVRLAYLTEQQSTSVLFYQPLLDEQEMVQSARQWLANGFSEPLFKAPLYPLYLAGVMRIGAEEWYWLARFVQHLLGAVLVLLAYDAARRTVGDGRSGRFAGVLAGAAIALYAPLIRLENQLILDFFTVFFQSAIIWSLIRLRLTLHPLRWAAAAGAVAALAWLNRPTITPVIPFLALWILSYRGTHPLKLKKQALAAGLFCLFPLLTIAGFYQLNLSLGEGLWLPWQGGYNFFQANRSGANGKYLVQESFSMAGSGNPTRELAEAGFRQAVSDGRSKPPDKGRDFQELNNYWMGLARQDIARAPAAWIGLMLRKGLYLFSDREIFNFESFEIHKHASYILRWLPFSFGWVWPLALASLALCRCLSAPRRSLAMLSWLYLLLLAGAIGLYFTSGRLRMPLIFPSAVLGAAGLSLLLNQWAKLAVQRKSAYALLFVTGVVMSWGNWWSVRSESQRHVDYARLSNAAWRDNQPNRALEYAGLAARENPDYPSIPLLRGMAYYSLKQYDDAAKAFGESLERMPADPVAPFNLGIIEYYHRPWPGKAEAMFAEALRRQPQYHQAAWMSGLVRLRGGDGAGAKNILAPYLPPKNGAPHLLLMAAAALATAEGDTNSARALSARIEQSQGEAGLKALAEEFALLGLTPPPAAGKEQDASQ